MRRKYVCRIILGIWCCIVINGAYLYAADKDELPIPQAPKKGVKKDLSPHQGIAELRAFVDKSSITIGEKVTYTLEIDADNNLEVEFPSYVSGLGGFAVKDFGKEDKKIGRRRTRRKEWYLLDTYTTGSYVIPAQAVKIKLSNGKTQILKSPEIFIEVKSLIDQGKKGGLRDIKEPLSVNLSPSIALILTVIIISLAVGGIILWKFYLRRFSAKKSIPPLPPEAVAFRELGRIEGMQLIEKERIKDYYYLVSLCLRSYLESRFSFNAPEQTTEEFLESVAHSDKLEGRHINLLKQYLNHCDLVKYAEFDPGKSQAKLLIETTRQFIEETTKDEKERGEENLDRGKT